MRKLDYGIEVDSRVAPLKIDLELLGHLRFSLNLREAQTLSEILEDIFLFQSGVSELITSEYGWSIRFERQGKSVIMEGHEEAGEEWRLMGAIATTEVYALALALKHVTSRLQAIDVVVPPAASVKSNQTELRLVVNNQLP